MYKILLYIFVIINFIYPINYIIQPDYGKIILNDEILDKPFLGGFNKPKIQWLDWNGDNFDDLFILDEDGFLRFYLFDSLNDSFNLESTNFLNLFGISWFYFGDFDFDGNYEIITQDSENINQLIYYDIYIDNLINLGTVYDMNQEALISDGVMTPTFCDIDADGDLDFFTGNIIGTITFYENINFDIVPKFNLVTNYWEEIYIVGPSQQRHGASAINFIDIDDDNDFDLSWGDYYQQSLYIVINNGSVINPEMDNVNIISQFPINNPVLTSGLNMPSFMDVDHDGDKDLFITVLSGAYGYQLSNNFYYYNRLDSIYDYSLQTQEFISTLDLLSDVSPSFVDINNDNNIDMFLGTDFDPSSFPWTGKIYYFDNISSSYNEDFVFSLVDDAYISNNLGNNLSLDFSDIDNDNDFDMFVGNFNGIIQFFENIGDANYPDFLFNENILNIDLSGYSTPVLVDIDSDNDFDLFSGDVNGKINFYENIGTPNDYNFQFITDHFSDISVGSRSVPEFIDFDNDNDFDLVVSSQSNGISYYQNIGNQYNGIFLLDTSLVFPNIGKNLSARFLDNKDVVVGISTGGLYYLGYCLSGDLNEDNIIDISDIVVLVNYIVQLLNSEFQCSIDFNSDSFINVIDIIALINLILD